jgi:SsrA-binding protein
VAKSKEETSDLKVITVNKKARFDYQLLETFEAGVVLSGMEIKSVRDGGVSLAEAYIRPSSGELVLIGAHVKEYVHSSALEYNPTRPRKLLMHKREIRKLTSRVEERGLTIVPLRLYLKKGLAKVELALARGKAAPDKRRTVIDREKKLEAQRAMKRRA